VSLKSMLPVKSTTSRPAANGAQPRAVIELNGLGAADAVPPFRSTPSKSSISSASPKIVLKSALLVISPAWALPTTKAHAGHSKVSFLLACTSAPAYFKGSSFWQPGHCNKSAISTYQLCRVQCCRYQ
jgi:hypothetical protein